MKKTTSERLKEIMAERNYRQVDILNKCEPYCKKFNIKLGRNDISQYVSGKVVPGQEKLTVLAHALGVTETWLMGYDSEKEPVELNNSDTGYAFMGFIEENKEFIQTFISLSKEDQNYLKKIAFALTKLNE